MIKKKPVGRPRFAASARRDHLIQVRASKREVAKYKAAAKKANLSLSQWIRATLKVNV